MAKFANSLQTDINSSTFVDINTLFKNSCYKYYSIPEVLIHLNNIIYKKTGTHPYPTYDINTLAQYTGGNACFELINDDMTYYTRFYINGYLINFDLPQYSNAICKKIPLEALNSYLAYVREQYLKNSKKIKSKRTIKSAPHEIN